MKKKNDHVSEQNASAEFDLALRGRSKLTTPLDRSAAQSDKSLSEIEPRSPCRDGLIEEILTDHPGSSREELVHMMRSFGF